ncbi:MAG: RepB family plasmid replication initiator protein [Leucothrix sp.]
MKNNSLVVKSNAVIDASYRLSLNEQRLLLLCISQIKKGDVVSEQTEFNVKASEFSEKFSVPLKTAYRELQSIADRLYDRSATIHNPDPEKPNITHLKTRWISSIMYAGNGQLTLGFAAHMIPYISLLEGRFTRYSIEAIAGMSSTYGMRFYELMKKWQTETGVKKNRYEIELEELKEILDLKNKYQAIKDFKKYVLEPAMNDIKNCTDLIASYTQRKTGRRVSHLIFTFNVDEQIKIKLEGGGSKKRIITTSYIEKHARPGESYEQAEKRLKEGAKKQK